jgi:bacillithiol system protein YtxJ
MIQKSENKNLIGPIDVVSDDDWEKIKAYIKNGYESVIFKYSSRCPISDGTGRTFDRWVNKIPHSAKLIIGKIEVRKSEELVNRIAEELMLTHHSPQVIWIDRDFDVPWHASHYDISIVALKKYLQKYLGNRHE